MSRSAHTSAIVSTIVLATFHLSTFLDPDVGWLTGALRAVTTAGLILQLFSCSLIEWLERKGRDEGRDEASEEESA